MTPRDAQASGEAKISLPRTLLDQMIAAAVQAAVREEREALTKALCCYCAEPALNASPPKRDPRTPREYESGWFHLFQGYPARECRAGAIHELIRSRAAGRAR